MNMYCRILDCYSEYLFENKGRDSPDYRRKRVKIFDLATVTEVVNDHVNNEGTDDKIDEWLLKFFSYDIVILPFYINEPGYKRCCLAVVSMMDESTFVTLWDRERPEYTDEYLDQLNASISYDVQIFLERAHLTNVAQLDLNRLEGSEKLLNVNSEIDMIPAILQLIEAIVIDPESFNSKNSEASCENLERTTLPQMQHKIIDRIVSLNLLE